MKIALGWGRVLGFGGRMRLWAKKACLLILLTGAVVPGRGAPSLADGIFDISPEAKEPNFHRSQVLYPPFLAHEYSGWIAVGEKPSEELLEAHEAFYGGFRSSNFHPAIQAFKKKLMEADHPPWAAEALWHIAEGYHRMRHFQEAAQYWSMTVRASGEKELASKAAASLAESLFQCWRLAEAYETLNSLGETGDPKIKSWALFRLADCAYELGEKAKAIETYQRALAMDPDPRSIPPESLENMARILEERGRGKDAARFLMMAISLHGENPRASLWMVLLARAMRAQGKIREAVFLAEKVAGTKGSRDASIAEMFLATVGLECYGAKVSISAVPMTKEILYPRSEVFTQDPKGRDTQRFLAELAECLAKRGDSILAWQLLGDLKRGLSPHSLWPEFQRALWNVGIRVMRESVEAGSFLVAEEIFQELADLFGGFWQEPSLLILAAKAKEELGFNRVAMELYGRARSLSSSKSQMWEPALGLIRCYLKEFLLDEAMRAFREEGALGPEWKKRGEDLIKWVSKIGTKEAGEMGARWLDGMVRRDPHPSTLGAMARLSVERGACQEALVLLADLLNPLAGDQRWGDPRVWVSLGDLLQCGGRTKDAVKWYARAASSEPLDEPGKDAALKLVRISMEGEAKTDLEPYLGKLLKEPPGSLWRVLAESIRAKITWREKVHQQGGKSS
jgi:tetratricopeptide (TPR) repeat protein